MPGLTELQRFKDFSRRLENTYEELQIAGQSVTTTIEEFRNTRENPPEKPAFPALLALLVSACEVIDLLELVGGWTALYSVIYGAIRLLVTAALYIWAFRMIDGIKLIGLRRRLLQNSGRRILIAALSILLVKRNPMVSPWFALLVNAYPIFETLFTIWRRKIHQGKNPGLPDAAHFHSLIYRRLIRWAEVHESKKTASYSKNANTSPYLWLLSSFAVFPAVIWWDITWVLQCAALLFCISYIWIYNAVVKFKTPDILKIFR
jgi:hypothetical protein